MAYLNPRYNGKVGLYPGNKIERFGTIPTNVFTPGPLGGMIFIPFNKALIPAPYSSSNSARYTYPMIQTETDQRSQINYNPGVPRDVSIAIDGVNYDIFAFENINPTINILSWQAGNGVYTYTGANQYPLYDFINVAGTYVTFSGVELKNALSITPASGRQIFSINVPATSSFTFASYTPTFSPYNNPVKAYFYNFTTSEVLTYVGSFSSANMAFKNYANTYI